MSLVDGWRAEILKGRNFFYLTSDFWKKMLECTLRPILPSVLKFQVDCICFHGGVIGINFGGKWNNKKGGSKEYFIHSKNKASPSTAQKS